MDALDRKILLILSENSRIPTKDISKRVALSAPAVAQRIRRMEASGVIGGYTVRLSPEQTRGNIRAIISIYVQPKERGGLKSVVQSEPAVEECYQVTGVHSHMMKVSCKDIAALESLISRLQKLGQTSTQIVLSSIPCLAPLLPE